MYLALRDTDPDEVNRWFALWTQHEDGTVWYSARTIDPARMTVSIQYSRREPGGDALYSVTTPATVHYF
ncbi:hypothetical protein [Dactylosporangium sp. NPDC005555]|uniref:hypothetical protein n=1 Tax=Dactylosporangium sp. NPDC005555 TaxID=3154889 RepID=UPI0033A4E58A